MSVKAVVFDIGEVLVDETGVWSRWADWFGVPRFTLLALIGAAIERGESYREFFRLLRPGIDIDAEKLARRAAGDNESFTLDEIYPDALPAFAALSEAGFRLAIAANQPLIAESVLGVLNLPVEFLVASERWGIHKPDLAFFERIATELQLDAGEIAYVGDRVDNDVIPANRAGMVSVFIRRGPWGYLQTDQASSAGADIQIDNLHQLLGAVRTWNELQSKRSGKRPWR